MQNVDLAHMADLRFPLGKTGGLIEASDPSVALHVYTLQFPLGKTGGLIEAAPCSRASPRSACCFRWVKPAASLKQVEHVVVRHDGAIVSAG